MADVRNPISILNVNDTSYNIKDVRRPYLVIYKWWTYNCTGTYTYTAPQRGVIIYSATVVKVEGQPLPAGHCKFYRSRSSISKLDTAVDTSLSVPAGSASALRGVASGALCVNANDVITVDVSSPVTSDTYLPYCNGHCWVYFMPFS